jgi:hypothetical protein
MLTWVGVVPAKTRLGWRARPCCCAGRSDPAERGAGRNRPPSRPTVPAGTAGPNRAAAIAVAGAIDVSIYVSVGVAIDVSIYVPVHVSSVDVSSIDVPAPRVGSAAPVHPAVEEGIVPGGGVALLRANAAIGKLSDDNADVQAGINIVLRALEAPIRQIVENAGVEGSIVVGKITESESQAYGFDAQTEQYVDVLSAGIVDPAKVVRVALQNAASIAGLMITTEAMVAERPKKEAPAMPGGGMGGMGGMDY